MNIEAMTAQKGESLFKIKASAMLILLIAKKFAITPTVPNDALRKSKGKFPFLI